MDTVKIRSEIHQAQCHEDATHELAVLLYRRIHHLHSAINLHSAQPHHQLLLFVLRYVSRTPDLLDTLLEATRNSPREELCDALAETCLEFFVSPPALLSGRHGLNGAMGKAYLCHRLVEELNDCCRLSTDNPLLPVDYTCSNLIVHQLIGEPFANLLDELVLHTTSRLRELGAMSLCPEGNSPQSRRLEAVCRSRRLSDEALSPSFRLTSVYPACTIH